MAEAQGKLSSWPGVCFVTRGPGASNAAIGLHTAFQDSTPMVLFVGQVAADQRDREAFQELDYRQVFGPGTLGMAKWVGEVQHADRLPEYVARAFHTAMQGRPGPGRAGAARRHADHADRGAGAAAHRAGAGLAGARRVAPAARAPAGGAAPARHCRRPAVERRERACAATLCRELAVAGGLRLSLSGHVRQPPSAVRRRRRHRHQSEARRARARGRPDPGHRRATGRDDDRRLRAPGGAAAAADAGASASGRRRTGPRLCRRPDAAVLAVARRPGARNPGGTGASAVGRLDGRGARRLRKQSGRGRRSSRWT